MEPIEYQIDGISQTQISVKKGLTFAAGVTIVWLVYLNPREVVAYTAPNNSVTLRGDDPLDGGIVLPGSSVPVAQLFAELDATQA